MFENLKNRVGTVKELFQFLWHQKLWWLIPFVVVLLFIGLLLFFAQSSPFIPFLYTAF